MRESIQEDFGFDCKCPVCSGELPNQDDIIREMADILISSGTGSEDEEEMTLSDWRRMAIGDGEVVDLSKSLYMGGPDLKMSILSDFRNTAFKARNPALVEKAVNGMKELAEKTGLEAYKRMFQEISQQTI